jgi:hypothetical protein
MEHINNNNVLNEQQYGFRKNALFFKKPQVSMQYVQLTKYSTLQPVWEPNKSLIFYIQRACRMINYLQANMWRFN